MIFFCRQPTVTTIVQKKKYEEVPKVKKKNKKVKKTKCGKIVITQIRPLLFSPSHFDQSGHDNSNLTRDYCKKPESSSESEDETSSSSDFSSTDQSAAKKNCSYIVGGCCPHEYCGSDQHCLHTKNCMTKEVHLHLLGRNERALKNGSSRLQI